MLDEVMPRLDTWRERERNLLWELRDLLLKTEGESEATDALKDLLSGLEELFLLMVVGEFNSGKSCFLNALLGEALLEEGPIPTTRTITVLKYGPDPHSQPQPGYLLLYRPHPLLKSLSLVDTPGTNSVLREHQQLTLRFIPRADLIFFVLSVDRALTESERALLELIRHQWQRKVVFILNKIDLLQEGELEQIVQFVQRECESLLGLSPRLFLLSARWAQQARQQEDQDLLAHSGLPRVEAFIAETLGEQERLALKLENPLHAAAPLLQRAADHLEQQEQTVRQDLNKVQHWEDLLRRTETEWRDNYEQFVLHVRKVLLDLRNGADRFIEESITFTHIREMQQPDRLQERFDREVVRDSTERIERVLEHAADWLVRRSAQLWQDTESYYRRELAAPQLTVGGREIIPTREDTFKRVVQVAQTHLAAFDREAESREIHAALRSACLSFVGLEAGALGLGAVLLLVFHSILADVSGALLATAVAALGLFVFPHQKKKARQAFNERLQQLQQRLEAALRAEFDRYIRGAGEEVRERMLRPVARFCEERIAKITEQQEALAALSQECNALLTELHQHLPTIGW